MKNELKFSIIISIVTLLLGPGIFYKVYYRPKLSYQILPIHKLDEKETHSIIINNKGRTILNNVIISIKTEKPIYELNIEGPEIMDRTGQKNIVSGMLGEKSIQLKLSRLIMRSVCTLTFSTSINGKMDIAIASDEINAIKERTGVGIFDYLISLLLAIFIGLITYYILKLKNLVTGKECSFKRQVTGKRIKETFSLYTNTFKTIINYLALAKQNYDNKEQTIKIIEGIESIIQQLVKTMDDFLESISTEGVCYNTKEKSSPERVGK